MKAFKKTLALFLATLMIVSAFSLYSVFAVTNGDDAVPESGMVTTNTPTLLGGTATASEPVPMSNTGAATANWAEETRNGVTAFYVDDLDDFKAFHDNSEANNWYTNKTVYITDDLDMNQASWTWERVEEFNGTLNGATENGNATVTLNSSNALFRYSTGSTIQNINFSGKVETTGDNLAVIFFQPYAHSTLNFKNILIDVDITGISNVGAFVSRLNGPVDSTGKVFEGDVTIFIENCVSDCDIVNTGNNTGGFVAYVESNASITIKNSAFTGSINGAGYTGGFVGRANKGTVDMTDCVFTGVIEKAGSYSSSMISCVQGSANLNRCVSLGMDPASGVNGYGALFFALRNQTWSGNITVEDCYAATDTYNAYAKHATADTKGTLTIKYGGVAVDDVKTVATKDGVALTTANFKAVCPELAANGWVATTNTVTYADGLTVPEILPATVATMLGRTVAASPVNAEQWHVKDNGETVDVRFIGSIKEDEAFLAKYDNVGIQITVVLKDTEDQTLIDAKEYNSTSVYTTVNTDASGVPAFVAEDGTYLFTANMRGFLKSATYEVTFVAFATYGGVDIFDYDGATTVTVTNGAIAE